MFPCEVSTPVILATRFNNEICILGDFNTRFFLSKNYRSYTFEIINYNYIKEAYNDFI